MFNKVLLSDSEINHLINAASITSAINSHKQLQHGRFGDQASSSSGSGTDFSEVRAYHPGDDPRHIDWRATARSQTPLLRTYHSELSQPLCLLMDRRSSMRFGTRVRLKVTQALRMALWIGGREARRGRDISAVLLDRTCHWLPPQTGLSSLKLIAKLGNKPCPPSTADSDLQDKVLQEKHKSSYKQDWNSIFLGLRQHIPQGSELILLSDFSGLGDEHNKMLRMLGKHCSSKVVHIFDPAEDFAVLNNFPAAIQLQWGKKSRLLASSEAINKQLSSRSEAMVKRFSQANMDYVQLSVEQNELALSQI